EHLHFWWSLPDHFTSFSVRQLSVDLFSKIPPKKVAIATFELPCHPLRKSGRDVVELMQKLAIEQKCTILLVTHDNRILDIADRIIYMEDGYLTDLPEDPATDRDR
ncbi:hypothetical protein PN466_00595, partial [Roseofilum reptotaenium CS-1145]|nr:hypothetical protein [Roseofilum reptotaenium CS-1145]